MTTEIAIMNKSAVALAADSAVTITVTDQHGETFKVLNSANKLFALSKCAPVGLMIYGNASMLGIPWETIVKMYRERLSDREFPTLACYCSNFFEFLDGFDITENVEKRYITNIAGGLFQNIRGQLNEWVQGEIATKKNISSQQIEIRLQELIKRDYNTFLGLGAESVLPKTKRTNLRKKYRSVVEGIAKGVFEQIPLTKQMKAQLLSIAVDGASIGPDDQSGVVIAGFGAEELYPSCHSYDVAAVLAGKTIKRDFEKKSITHNMSAVIIPFAQSDDVRTFMTGIGPVIEQFLKNAFYSIMVDGLPDQLRDQIAAKLNLDDQQKADVRKIVGDMCKGACDYAFKELSEQQRSNYIEPVVKATEFLNKAELSAMAETLVSLVSFRKQVSMEAETVGGPIDVAVITKGDGLVWIKRKNYFPAEINHHFFTNYYRKVMRNECQKEK